MTEEQIGRDLIGAALKVHSAVGPGLLESAYETCLLYELEKQNLPARRQVLIPFRDDDLTIDNGYRIDLLVGELVVVELKALEAILPVHRAQLLSYLRLGGFKARVSIEFQCRAHARRYREDGQWSVILCDLCASFAPFALKRFFRVGECARRR